MTHDVRGLHRRAGAEADRVIGAIRLDELGRPTPCAGWDVRALLNHLVNGNVRFKAIVAGEAVPDRDAPALGEDPVAAFRSTLADLTEAFDRDGALDVLYATPVGEERGAQLVATRVIELVVHSWDLWRATGQPSGLDAEVCARCLEIMRGRSLPRGDGRPFAPEQHAPEGAPAADALAAFAGRLPTIQCGDVDVKVKDDRRRPGATASP
jgi:uncharacterized protein (TIGR03086 family)